jgi:hypothetical protein
MKPATAASLGDETNMLLDQPAKKNVHAGEEVDVVDNLSTIPSTSIDDEAEADARRGSKLKYNKPTISYAETIRSLGSESFC